MYTSRNNNENNNLENKDKFGKHDIFINSENIENNWMPLYESKK